MMQMTSLMNWVVVLKYFLIFGGVIPKCNGYRHTILLSLICIINISFITFLNLGNHAAAATAAKLLQSCPTLCDPIDGSPPGSPVPGLLQARTLEWAAIAFSNAWKWKVKGKLLSRARLLVTPWTTAYQAPPSMGFSRQKYWSGVPLPYRLFPS